MVNWKFSIETSNGDFIVSGYTWYTNELESLRLLKVDSGGSIIWDKHFDYGRGNDIIETTNGNYVVTGFKHNYLSEEKDLWIINTDSNGDLVWQYTYGTQFQNEEGNAIVNTYLDDGYAVAVASRNADYNGTAAFLQIVKINNDGNFQWEITRENQLGYDINQSLDNGFIITGIEVGLYTGEDNDIVLLKVAPESLGCTDTFACNYDENAEIDDGSCAEFDLCGECGGNNDTCANISDIDGNLYSVIEIGNQKWMGQNLRVTRFNNGDAINDVENLQNENWDNLTEPSMFRYENYDSAWESAENIVGNLYNWYVVSDDRQVCPEGWHVPSDDEYKEEIYLGMSQLEADLNGQRGTNEGSKLSDYCTGHPINETCWPNTGSPLTDDILFGLTDFNLYPAGHVYNNQLNSPTTVASHWTSTQRDVNSSYQRLVSTNPSGISRQGDGWYYGNSIRCIENIYGCMDEDACNYDDLANIDDGSCEYNSSIWYVSEDGNDTCGNQEQPLSSIQDAIDLAQDGDTIYVSAGTYYEHINFSSKNLALIGEDRETTIIDGGNTDRVILFLNSDIKIYF